MADAPIVKVHPDGHLPSAGDAILDYHPAPMDAAIDDWLTRFNLHPRTRQEVLHVMCRLPAAVRLDFVDDPAFLLCDIRFDPAGGWLIPLASPTARGPSRCVALKPALCSRPSAFVRYVIAHELAHAHLRNGGRFDGEDPEIAADSLAAEWGFPRPARP